MQSYNSYELWTLNLKYGGGWITNIQSTNENDKKRYHLHPTGNCTLSGREYVVVDSTKILTAEEKRRLNII